MHRSRSRWGPTGKPPSTPEAELSKLAELAPKGEALYNPAYDKRFAIVNDPDEQAGSRPEVTGERQVGERRSSL
ncbi:hypothetical protein FXN61_08830 [Lentzea sp. PSKA42]|uniref:Uncharacterized protein n=1 Tax=Lentzea indica TaxID=2604800 RepID=A0ABX1FDD7_9PSEU|nr:hypothetical protein [Lentzea indica]NKE56934.1 hypothetical protein [Lentzea indica]